MGQRLCITSDQFEFEEMMDQHNTMRGLGDDGSTQHHERPRR